MFALRSAVVLTYLVVATGRRHADRLGQLNPEDVAKAEEKTAEVLESLTPHGGDGKMIPIEASFQVASTMGDMPVKTKMTLLMSHVSTASDSETPSLVCQLTAKNEVAASNFAKSLKEYWDANVAGLGMARVAPPVNVEIAAPGRQVLIKVTGTELTGAAHAVAAVQAFASNLGHVNVSVDMNVDMQEVMATLSNDTVLYEELYKGFKYSVDLTLTKALENMIASRFPESPPGAPFSAQAMVNKLFNLFTGASADVKVGFDESTRADLIRSIPFVNMTYAQMVSIYRPLVTMYPAMLRGTDIALKSLNVLLGLETMETLDTVEVKGVPGVQLMMVGNTTSGAFDFMGKLVKDVGLVEVLRNTSTEFMPQYVPPPEFAPYTGTTTPYVPPAGYTG